ncbi:MAG: MBG domain-containing protein [Myxococcota bacterium]|jgi:hypothetical protein
MMCFNEGSRRISGIAAVTVIGIFLALTWQSCSSYPDEETVGQKTGRAVFAASAGDVWTNQARISPFNGDPFRILENADISGDTVLLEDWTYNNGVGEAYIFVRDGSSWTQQARLAASDGMPNDVFGISIAISGDTAVVGAINASNAALEKRGAVYVFVRDGAEWKLQAKLTANEGANRTVFGRSVAVSGDTIAVGGGESNSGPCPIYVFVRSGGSWVQQAKLLGEDITWQDMSFSISISGDTILAGAEDMNNYKGAAYVFVRNGTAWTQQAKLVADDGIIDDRFGSSVSLSSNTAVVGASCRDARKGAAYVFRRNGTAWHQEEKIVADDGEVNDQFGSKVAVSGETLVVGASNHNHGKGVVYVFTWAGTDWVKQAELDESANGESQFGYYLAISNDTIVVPAGNQGPGEVYVYVRKYAAEVMLTNLSHVYDGTPKSATATTTPAGLTVKITYDGSELPPTAAGKYSVVADVTSAGYSGSAAGIMTIGKAKSAVSLVSSNNPSMIGEAVNFTASITGSGVICEGSVVFKDASTELGAEVLSGGAAGLPVSTFTVGTHSITAWYSGDANRDSSVSKVLYQVVTVPVHDGGVDSGVNDAGRDSGSDAADGGTGKDSGGDLYTDAAVKDAGTTPAEDAGSNPVKDAGSTPVEDAGATPVKDAGSTPVKDAGSTPVEDAGTTPVEDAGTTPAEDAGTTPVKDAGTTPAKDAGSTPAEDAGATPVKDAGSTPAEDAGATPVNDAAVVSDEYYPFSYGCGCSSVGDLVH